MRNLFVILRQEIFSLLISPATFIAGFYFLLVMGLMFWFYLGSYHLSTGRMPPIFELAFGLFIMTPTIIPFLTMRSLAEERRTGTLETLLATPTPTYAIVVGKWGAAYLYYLSLCVLALGFPAVTHYFFEDKVGELRFMDLTFLFGGGLYLMVSGAAFVAIGIFASSLTRSQLVAGMLTFTLLLIQLSLIYYFHENQPAAPTSMLGETIHQSLGAFFRGYDHLREFSRGIIDTRPIVYYLTSAALFLGFATLVTEHRSGE